MEIVEGWGLVNVDQRGEEGVRVAEVAERDLDLAVAGE